MEALSTNVLKSNDKLHLMTCRISVLYELFSFNCFLNSRWSTFFHAWLQFSCWVTASGEGSHEACECLGGIKGDPSFPYSPPFYPPTLLSTITFLSFHLFFLLLPSSFSPGDTWFSGCHQFLPLPIVSPHLLPLSLSPDFPDPCRTKLSLRVS